VFNLFVEISGVMTLVDTFKVIPEMNQDYGKQDFSRALQKYVVEEQQAFDNTGMVVNAPATPIKKFRVDVVEEYGDPATEREETAITGADMYCWSGVFDSHDWINQINEASPFNTWLLNTTNGTSAEFLTAYKTPKVSINDAGWTTYLTDTTGDMDYVEVKTYNSAGGLIQTIQVAITPSIGATADRMQTIATAPSSLNNYVGPILAGAQPFITSSVATYTVQVFETTPTASSEILTFTVDEACRYDVYRIHFLNKLGGIDAYNFRSRSQENTEVKRKSYTRSADNIQASGIVYDHEDNGTTDYFVKYRDKITLRSEYLTEAEQNWLKELITSPLVFLEFTDLQGNQNFKPVKVTTNRWMKKTKSIDKIFKLEVGIDIAQENFRQRR
jgi:hypothetical protein